MEIKKLIKRVSSPFMCYIHGLKNHGNNIYIGIGAKIVGGDRIYVADGAEFTPYSMVVCLNRPHSRIEIGKNTRISMFSRIGAAGYIKLGSNIEMGPNIFIADYNHKYDDIDIPILFQGITAPLPNGPYSNPTLEIGDDCWLGTNVVIVGRIKIGKHCVIGANSVVNSDIPDYSVAVGSPARVVKRFDMKCNKWVKAASD